MLLKDFNARFTLAQIRSSVWFKRRHPPLQSDHFAQVPFKNRLFEENLKKSFKKIHRSPRYAENWATARLHALPHSVTCTDKRCRKANMKKM